MPVDGTLPPNATCAIVHDCPPKPAQNKLPVPSNPQMGASYCITATACPDRNLLPFGGIIDTLPSSGGGSTTPPGPPGPPGGGGQPGGPPGGGHPIRGPGPGFPPGGPNPPQPAQDLPVRQNPHDQTDCVVVAPGQDPERLSSRAGIPGVPGGKSGPGWHTPRGTRGFWYQGPYGLGQYSTNVDCEAQAIATMIQNGWQSADLWINNEPCSGPIGCNQLMSHRLPPGWTLNVFVSDLLNFGTNDWILYGIWTGAP